VEAIVKRLMPAAREQSRGECAVDGAIHVLALVAALIGIGVLIGIIAVRSGLVEMVTAVIYGAGLLAMLGFSAAYNLGWNSRHRELLRRFDQAAIFVMIAGTYTPFTILGLDGAWEISLMSFVWTIALLGLALKLFLPRRLEGVSLAIYLALGWTGVVAAGPFINALNPPVPVLLTVGGVLYSIGTIFHVWRRLPYQNAIWHAFVVAAAAVHYSAVLNLVIHG
jgi:hemolysin III